MIIGDFHIPYKTLQVPAEFRQYLNPGKVDHVLCTGNVCNNQILELVKQISNNFSIVKGDCDFVSQQD